MKKVVLILAALLFASAASFGQAKIDLTGAGATFPAPLYTAMFDQYLKVNGTKVNYAALGSGAGIQQLTAKTVDFGASDAPMTDKEQAAAKDLVLHIPTTVGSIVLTYNIPGVRSNIKLTGQVIADIFLGNIDKWSDPAIAAINPGVKFPDIQIIVVRRSDSSGTSFNFTNYLSKESDTWAKTVGVDKNPKWPVGVGGKGNAGVAAYIKQVPGAFGYVEIAYALQNKMPAAFVKNKAGNFIDPASFKALAAAADVAFPADAKADIIDTDAKDGYPIAATTWLLIYQDQTYTGNQAKSKAVVDLIWWMLHDGQKLNEANKYGVLPPAAVKVAEALLKSVVFNGQALIK